VAVLIDANALLAQADASDPRHEETVALLRQERETIVTSELTLAEADYLILRRLGPEVELSFIDDVTAATFVVECLTREEMVAARGVIEQYRDLRLGLADASLVVLAKRYATTRIVTFDERAFRPVAPLQGGAFKILPADLAR
jgi:predicted nucleic acid-binding protein